MWIVYDQHNFYCWVNSCQSRHLEVSTSWFTHFIFSFQGLLALNTLNKSRNRQISKGVYLNESMSSRITLNLVTVHSYKNGGKNNYSGGWKSAKLDKCLMVKVALMQENFKINITVKKSLMNAVWCRKLGQYENLTGPGDFSTECRVYCVTSNDRRICIHRTACPDELFFQQFFFRIKVANAYQRRN